MKYGESLFDILYLAFAIVSGLWLLRQKRVALGRLMGTAALVLGLGDAFHLAPRVLNYFVDADFTAALGVGKLVTSVTMTLFYLLMDKIWRAAYDAKHDRAVSRCLGAMIVLRIVLCLLPQNRWLTNEGSVTWGIIRNVPFVVVGVIIAVSYFMKRREVRAFRNVWLYVALSFLFYIPVAVGASVVPMLGMLMLPKTICYVLIIAAFRKYVMDNAAP